MESAFLDVTTTKHRHTEIYLTGSTLKAEEWVRIPQEGKDVDHTIFSLPFRIEHNSRHNKLGSSYLLKRDNHKKLLNK